MFLVVIQLLSHIWLFVTPLGSLLGPLLGPWFHHCISWCDCSSPSPVVYLFIYLFIFVSENKFYLYKGLNTLHNTKTEEGRKKPKDQFISQGIGQLLLVGCKLYS